MATLILASVGTALGGPIGGALGSLIGKSIDEGLFGPGNRKGPRLGDLSVQTSSYGSPIPRIYGTMRVAGSVVWATDLKEEELTEGGGKSGPERQYYSYSASLAVALSSRPIRSIRRIWADGKLIRGSAGDFKVRTKFRLASGSEDQALDPLIASVEGIAKAPAYRGLALAIFEDLELAEFGNRIPMLTFEVEADDGPPTLSSLLRDVSGGLIEADSNRLIEGYAAHGSSVRDGIGVLVDAFGIELVDKNGKLRLPTADPPFAIQQIELGCNADGQPAQRTERIRLGASSLPTGMSVAYYDPDRDYQAGQMRASAGEPGSRNERIELPAALRADEAKLLAEAALTRRWQSADRLKLRLPPARLPLRPGDSVQLAGSGRSWTIQSCLIDSLAVIIEVVGSSVGIEPLPADPGRAVSEPDKKVGRSELLLFELPPDSDAPSMAPTPFAAASNDGLWKSLPIALTIGAEPIPAIAIGRRATIGRALTALEARCPMVLDEMSGVTVQLVNKDQILLSADQDALMAGANLALIGAELVQFGRVEKIGPGQFRLSKLLRGRRATEWAAATHFVGEPFLLIDPSAMQRVELLASALGATLAASAHGVGDFEPLPTVAVPVTGEAMRPPSPCHLRLRQSGNSLVANWVRRSHCGWSWIDHSGVATDPFPERYRVTVNGPAGSLTCETSAPTHCFDIAELPAQHGQPIGIAVAMIGPAALSHPTYSNFIL